MKRVLTFIILIISLFLISGCGETEQDKINSTDPKKFAIESFKEKYGEDIEIEVTKSSTEYYKYSQSDKGYRYEEFTVKTVEDKPVEFKMATYWEVSDAIPTRHYSFSTDYGNIIVKKVLEEEFKDNDKIKFEDTKKEIDLYKYTPGYEFKLIINDKSELSNLSKELYDLSRRDKVYDFNVKIICNGKNINISLNNKIDIKDIEKKMKNLE